MRRSLINLALALVLVPATVAMVVRRIPDAPVSVLAFPKPTHRVAVAVDEAMRAELASVVPGNCKLSQDYSLMRPNGRPPTIDKFVIPEDYPAFWWDPGAPATAPMASTLYGMRFDGTTRDGRSVQVTVKNDPIGEGSIVDCHGDVALARALELRIAYRLAHPKHKHESPEDRAALMAFFATNMPAAKTPAGKVDPAVRQTAGSDDMDTSDEDQ